MPIKPIIVIFKTIWANPGQRAILLGFLVLNALLMIFSIPQGPYAAGADVAVSLQPARSLLAGAGFIHPNGQPYVWGTPLYPLFLALFIGWLPLSVALYVIVAVQCVLLYLTGLMARSIAGSFSPRIATLAQVILLFNPNILITAHLIQTEILFTFFMAAAVLLLFRFCEHPSWMRAAGCGVLAGLATLVRPVGQFAVFMLPVFFSLLGIGKNIALFKQAFRAGILALAAAVLVVAPWVIRNYSLFGSPFLTVNKGYYLEDQYRQLLHTGYGMADDETKAAATGCVNKHLAATGLDSDKLLHLPKYVQSRILSESYLKAILTVPVSVQVKALFEAVLQLYFSGGASNICNYLGIEGKQAIVQFQNEKRTTGFQALSRFLSRINWGYAVLLALASGFAFLMRLAGIVGLVRMFRDGKAAQALVLIMILAIFTGAYLYLGQSRFRVPLEPYLAIMAAMGFTGIRDRWHSRKSVMPK